MARPNPWILGPRDPRHRRDHYSFSSSSSDYPSSYWPSSASSIPAPDTSSSDFHNHAHPASSSSSDPSPTRPPFILHHPTTFFPHHHTTNSTSDSSATHTAPAMTSETNPPPAAMQGPGGKDALSPAGLAAAVMAPLVVLLVLAGAGWWFCCGRKQSRSRRERERKEAVEKLDGTTVAGASLSDDSASDRTLVAPATTSEKRSSRPLRVRSLITSAAIRRPPSDPTPPAPQRASLLPPMAHPNPTAGTRGENPSYFTGLDTWSSASESLRSVSGDYGDAVPGAGTGTGDGGVGMGMGGAVRRGVRISVAGTIGGEEPPPPYEVARDAVAEDPFADPLGHGQGQGGWQEDRGSMLSDMDYDGVTGDGYGGRNAPRASRYHQREALQTQVEDGAGFEAQPLYRRSASRSPSPVSALSAPNHGEEDVGGEGARFSSSTVTRAETPRPFSLSTIGSRASRSGDPFADPR